MADDYLWDGGGEPDPEIQRLEALLRPLGHASAPFDAARALPGSSTAPSADGFPQVRDLPGVAKGARASAAAAYRLVLPLAAMLVAAIGAGWIVAASVQSAPGWEVARLDPTGPGAASRGGALRLPAGGWLDTGAGGDVRIQVGGVGRVDVAGGSRVRLTSARAGDYRLRLARGTLHALIWAPPGQFTVDTPSSTVVDLGCAYTLRVDDDGAGVVEVTSGWVGFAWRDREAFIPAGAMCATRPGTGPGTPHQRDVSPAFAAALARLDFGEEPAMSISGVAPRPGALDTILAESRAADAVTLWHLLARVDAAERDRVFDRLAAFVPPPDGVTREGIRAGNREMRDRWWDALDLGPMALWRRWQQGWRDEGGR